MFNSYVKLPEGIPQHPMVDHHIPASSVFSCCFSIFTPTQTPIFFQILPLKSQHFGPQIRRPSPWRPTRQFACRQCQPPGPSTKRHLVRHDFWSFLERCGTMLPNMMDTLPGYNMTQLPLQVDNSDYTTSIPDVSSVCSERVILTGCPSKNCFRPQDQEMVELVRTL